MSAPLLLKAMLVVGLVTLGSAAVSARRTWQLATGGQVVTATVERAGRIKNGGTLLELSFTLDGRPAHAEAQWPSSRAAPKEGSTVEVRALPSAPEMVVPADEGPDWLVPALLAVLGLAFVVVPAVLLRRS